MSKISQEREKPANLSRQMSKQKMLLVAIMYKQLRAIMTAQMQTEGEGIGRRGW